MTIKEFIIGNTAEDVRMRMEKLKEMGAPAILIRSCEEELDRLNKGDLRCSGDTFLLEEEFESHELRKGRGGIPYHVFNGNINYFPKAKYGRFVAKGEVK